MSNLVELRVIYPNAKIVLGVFADRYSPYSYSRYKRKEVLLTDVYDYGTMYPSDMSVKSSNYTTYVVKQSEENRLDIISQKFYGTPALFWVICYFNDILDPLSVPSGTVLKIPSIAALFASGGVLS